MKLMLAMPCLSGAGHVEESISSMRLPGVDLCLIDNGADSSVKKVLKHAGGAAISNKQNVYVNPAWNQAMAYFLDRSQYDVLTIANSDVVMDPNWLSVLTNRVEHFHDEITIPRLSDDRVSVMSGRHTNAEDWTTAETVPGGVPGVFMVLRRKVVERVFPIPEEMKIWFGDDWIFTIARELGYHTRILHNLLAFHHWSKTIAAVPEAHQVIEEDKKAWELVGKPMMLTRIEKEKHRE